MDLTMDLSEFYNLITEKVHTWAIDLIKMLPNLIITVLVIVIGFILAKWLRRKAEKIMKAITHVEIISSLFGSLVYALVIAIVLFMALRVLNLDKALTTVLAGAGIIGLALAFAFQDIAANFVSGIFLTIRLPIRIGHLVQIGEHTGTVLKMTLRDTVIRTFHGQDVIIPNKIIFESPLINYTSSSKRCIDLGVGASYGDQLPNVKNITLEALKALNDRIDPTMGILFYYDEFKESSVSFFVRIWLKDTSQAFFLETRSEAIAIIKNAFDEHKLSIPFPIRTLDFDVKGGKNISQMQVHIKED